MVRLDAQGAVTGRGRDARGAVVRLDAQGALIGRGAGCEGGGGSESWEGGEVRWEARGDDAARGYGLDSRAGGIRIRKGVGRMKLCLFELRSRPGEQFVGAWVEGGAADLTPALGDLAGLPPQRRMEGVIDGFERLRPAFERIAGSGATYGEGEFRLRAPLPRPGKILCCIGNYWEHAQREPRPLNMFLKSPDAVIGPGDTVVLPRTTDPWVFQHEAELAVVARGPSKDVGRGEYLSAVFGYTCMIDVSARGQGRSTWRSGSWMGKSFDTFAPLGPVIVTADELGDPNGLRVRFWNDDQLRHDYGTDDMEHRAPELVEFATSIMTLNTGDVVSCGTNHEGLGPLQDGETGTIEIEGIGRMSVGVSDPLKRTWERGIYMGPDSTAHRG